MKDDKTVQSIPNGSFVGKVSGVRYMTVWAKPGITKVVKRNKAERKRQKQARRKNK
jgi:hypothetical protein